MTQLDEDGRHVLFRPISEFQDQHIALVDVPDYNGWYPLHAASSRGDLKSVQLLIENGASVNVKTENGQTPLHYAVSKGHIDIVRVLVQTADLTLTDQNGQSVFHRAASKGDVEIAKLLLPANWSLRDKQGNTPLHFAAEDAQAKFIVWCVKTYFGDSIRHELTEVLNNNNQSVQDLLTDLQAFEEVKRSLA